VRGIGGYHVHLPRRGDDATDFVSRCARREIPRLHGLSVEE